MRQARIALDCRLAGPSNAGIGRYIENLVIRLPALAPELRWIFIFNNHQQAQQVISQISTPQDNVQTEIAPIRHYTIAEQTKLPKILHSLSPDLVHVPHFNAPIMYRGPMVLTIHDLLWHRQTGLYMTTLKPWQYHLKYLAYRFVSKRAIKAAKQIMVPANTVKQELISFFPEVASKVKITTEGYNPVFNQTQKSGSSPSSNQLIYVGSLYPHKNVGLVIKALKDLPQIKLKIVGSRVIFRDRLEALAKKIGVSQQVIWAGYLSDQKLVQEFNQSLALVQPSKSEGFGLTGIVAMAAGLPVLASNIETFAEIYQQAPVFFDPDSVESFTQSAKTLKEPKIHSQAITQGRQVASLYSWDQMTQNTLKVYQQALKLKP